MAVKQISVFLENKPGALLEFTKLLKEKDVNIRALSLAEISEYGVARLIVNDNYEVSQILKEEGYIYKATPVLAAPMEDKPGSLVAILEALDAASINVEYTYAFTSKNEGQAYIILKVNDVEGGQSALVKAGIKALTQEEIEKL